MYVRIVYSVYAAIVTAIELKDYESNIFIANDDLSQVPIFL